MLGNNLSLCRRNIQLKALVRNKKIISHKTDKGNTVVINYKEKYTGVIPKLYYKR